MDKRERGRWRWGMNVRMWLRACMRTDNETDEIVLKERNEP